MQISLLVISSIYLSLGHSVTFYGIVIKFCYKYKNKKSRIWTYEGSPLDLNWLASNDNVFPMSIVLNEDNMHIC